MRIFLEKAAEGEYCFVETFDCGPDMFPETANVEAVVLYKMEPCISRRSVFSKDLSGGKWWKQKNLQVLPMKR